ncbi:MAG TPA: universal stress protein [Terriglobales bacterium]|nr:universal stress protein [Terriglobales bacterium]
MNAMAVPTPITIDIKRILCPTDFSPVSLAALPVASTLAEEYGAEVFLTHICSPVPYTAGSPEMLEALERREENEAWEKLRNILVGNDLRNVPASSLVRWGGPVDEVNRLVRDDKVDMIVTSTHGRTGWKHLLMGSVAEELLRTVPCPVITVGPKLQRRFAKAASIKNIVYATDLSEESKAAFPYVASMATRYRAALTLLHVLPIENADNPNAKLLAQPWRDQMRKTFSPCIDWHSAASYEIDFGDPAERILFYAKEKNAELIAFGVRRRSEVATHLRNTTTYRVILDAHCPVLTASFWKS